jgi:hypothetical protein
MNKGSPSGLLLYWRIEVKVRVSHISRKTSEIWGTLRLVARKDPKRSVHSAFNLPMASQWLGMTIRVPFWGDQYMIQPPSTLSVWPVIASLNSVDKNRQTRARSSGVRRRLRL